MEAIQAKLKKQEAQLAKLRNATEKKLRAIQETLYKQGTLVRTKYLTNPVVLTALGKHGGVTPRNLARLAVAIGTKRRAGTVTGLARSLKNAQNANIARMQQQYRNWYNGLSAQQRRNLAENYHKVLEPNAAQRARWKNSNLFKPALLRNTNLTRRTGNHFALPRKVLHNLNNKNIKAVLVRYGNPVPLNTLKQLILARNGLRSNWKPPSSYTYNRYNEYSRLTRGNNEYKYMLNKYY